MPIAHPDIHRLLDEYEGPDFPWRIWELEDPDQVIAHLPPYYSRADAPDGPCIMEAALRGVGQQHDTFDGRLARMRLLEGISEYGANQLIRPIVEANDDDRLDEAADLLLAFLRDHVHLAPVVEIPPCLASLPEPARTKIAPLLQDARHAAHAAQYLSREREEEACTTASS